MSNLHHLLGDADYEEFYGNTRIMQETSFKIATGLPGTADHDMAVKDYVTATTAIINVLITVLNGDSNGYSAQT